MKKVMKTFIFGSKGFMRILLLCMIACFSLTQARADYYYKVKLADMNGNPYPINGKEWSDWISVSKGSGLANALNKLIGGKFSEQEKDASGNLKFKYNDNNVEKEISLSEAVVEKLTKNQDGNYLYNKGGKDYVLNPVTKDVYRLGRTIKDESDIAISLKYTIDGNIVDGKEMAKEENFYEKYTHTYKIVGLAIGRGTNDGAILQFSDWDAFSRMKQDLKELDLAAWNKEKVNGSFYMSNMSNLEKLILPDHNFAIGGDYMFAGANKLKIIQYGNYGANNDAENLTINTDANKCKVTCIGNAAFENCNNLPGSYIKEMVNSAAAYAKEHANEDGFKYNKIGDNAFYHCYAFTDDFAIPDGIKYIGKQAFENGKISTLTCTSELKKIDDRAFKQNYQLQTVDLSNINEIGIEAFDMKNDGNNKPLLSEVSLGGNDIRIYSKAFRKCCYMTEFELKADAKIKQLNEGVFLDCRLITDDAVQTIINNYAANSDQYYEGKVGAKFIPANLFYGANGKPDYGTDAEKNTVQKNFTELVIPSEFVVIGKGAFGVSETSNIKSITVSRGVAPKCDVLDGTNSDVTGKKAFEGVNPNYVTVYFNGDAAGYSTGGSTGYMTYRKEQEFMRLLTKTLDENSTDYTVVPQRHADVRLYRTFKEGWNTLVLPFGARYLEGDTEADDCSRIFQKALNASNTEGFMIAAYRGLAKNEAQPDNSTFYFLKYANYDKDPLDEFEPLLIKMTQKDIDDAKGKGGFYTFKNVELNYDGDFDDGYGGKYFKEYTAEEAKERMGKKHTGDYFDGNYDQEANDKFKKCSYDDFYFTGTLYKQDTDKNPAFIAPGDYIIQNNTFVKCRADKKYGLKGFRGYFKQKKPSGETSGGQSGAKGNIGICLVDRNGVVSSIHQVDGVSLTSASVAPVAVYNLSGQKVGNSLSTLAKGVYIVNGKKFVKK